MKKKKFSRVALHDPLSPAQPSAAKKKTLLYVVGGFIILVMVGSILGYYTNDASSSDDRTTYGTYTFFPYGSGWAVRLGTENLPFAYHPKDLEHYPREPLLLGQKVYLAFNPREEHENKPELQRLRAYLLYTGKTVHFACSQDDGCGDLPIVPCTQPESILYYKQGLATSLHREANCYILSYKQGEETQATELAAYQILSII